MHHRYFLPLILLLPLCFLFAAEQPGAKNPKDKPAPKPEQKEGLKPADSLARFVVPGDLGIDQVLSEPVIAQPIFLNFDERGRMWVVEYRQYPYPAGLKIVSRDKYWRSVYDKVPPPPPNHFRGKDRISIHEDTRGNGVYDKHTTFVDGLNIATSAVKGRGGVWVLNPPYLLFYPDKNNDDIPDGDPVVHLEGFGIEDTHSCANSLTWGPDGWLYGAQGSTVSGKVIRPGLDKVPVSTMGQLIWRYHPETRRYEIYAEGGGNAFGVEIDSKGRVFSGHNGGNTRGFHYVQGGYYQKGFDKHGQLSNPYTFGYFSWMKHPQAQRFSHSFVFNEGNALPERYRGKLFAVLPLQGEVVYSDVKKDGSSFQTTDLGKAIVSTDAWFRPVNIQLGPDGALYVADFYDGHIAHLRHFEGKIDDTTGRVYRLRAADAKPSRPIDLGKLGSEELLKTLGSENRWVRDTALRLIADRKDAKVLPTLTRMLEGKDAQLALQALWAVNLCGGFNDALALKTLDHADPYVRLWTVRLLGDNRKVSTEIADKLAQLAAKEKNVEVRSQLACSARRLPAADGLPIVRQLLGHSEDLTDAHVPLLLWWAIEARAETDRDAVMKLFEDKSLWQLPLVKKEILERTMRRYAAVGRQKDLITCAQLLRSAPAPEQAQALLAGFEKAFAGRPIANLPRELVEALAARGGGSLALRLRLGDTKALDEALATIVDAKAKENDRLQLIQVFGEVSQPRSVPGLLKVLAESRQASLQQAALTALQLYGDPNIGAAVVARYPELSPNLRAAAQSLLASRAAWTKQLLQAVDAGKVDKGTVPPEAVRKFLLYRDEKIQQLARKNFGEVKGATTAEMRVEIDRLVKVVRSGPGEPYEGKKLFDMSCAKCHQLYSKGGDFGPNLTSYKRDDVDNMMLHIVNPSAEIREGYENYMVVTADGRSLNGFLLEKDEKIVVLRGAEGQTTVINKEQIDEMTVLPVSLMPEGLLRGMTDQQVRNLFAYLRSGQPLNVKD